MLIIIVSFLSCNFLFANEKAKEVSRYETALELAGKLAELENNAGCFSRQQLMDLEKKCVEFSDELTKLGINVSSLEKDLADVKEDIAALKLDVDAVKSTEKLQRGKQRFTLKKIGCRKHLVPKVLYRQMSAKLILNRMMCCCFAVMV